MAGTQTSKVIATGSFTPDVVPCLTANCKAGTATASFNTPGETHHGPGCVSELVFTTFPVVCIVMGAGRITTELPRLEGQAERNQSWAVWSQDLGFPF